MFPELANAPDAMIQVTLDQTINEIDTGIFKAKTPQAHGYLTAHRLTLSPWGQTARLAAKDGTTTYETHYKLLKRMVGIGFRVA